MAFSIVTDVAGDLPQSYIDAQENLVVIPMPYQLDGKSEMSTPYDGSDKLHGFYEALKNGSVAVTAQINPGTYQDVFEALLKKGEDVLYIGFSSGLSGSFQSAVMARNAIIEKRPSARLFVVDGLSASLGQGLLVHYAIKMRAQGKPVDEVAAWVHDNRQKVLHCFTVDDLDFLFRGGRLSKSSAVVGGVLKIKPILQINYEGKLIPREKVAGRKRSLKELAERYARYAVPKEGEVVFISHSDDLDAAHYTAEQIKKLVPNVGEFFFAPIGHIIGAHAGPGTVAVCFMGAAR